MTLRVAWYILIGVLLIGYAILDGFDLGVGVLYRIVAKTDRERRILLNSIGPVWDGNEVWILTGGGALFAAFPQVYATVFSGFYLALMLVLFALIFRAAATEFRVHDATRRRFWEGAFVVGSLLPALLYGVAIGNVVQGVPLNAQMEYTGNQCH
jgi:cytochrome d ubiquinol oxidase subunit II